MGYPAGHAWLHQREVRQSPFRWSERRFVYHDVCGHSMYNADIPHYGGSTGAVGESTSLIHLMASAIPASGCGPGVLKPPSSGGCDVLSVVFPIRAVATWSPATGRAAFTSCARFMPPCRTAEILKFADGGVLKSRSLSW